MSKPYKSDKKDQFFEIYKKKVCNISATCEALGICRDTYYEWRKDKDFDRQCKEVEEGLIDFAETALIKNVREGVQKAIEFFLKNRASSRWKEKQEHSFENPPKFVVEIVKNENKGD